MGNTAEQVKGLGLDYRVGKFPFLANSRAKAIDDAEGVVKILADKETDKILGGSISRHRMLGSSFTRRGWLCSMEPRVRTLHARVMHIQL